MLNSGVGIERRLLKDGSGSPILDRCECGQNLEKILKLFGVARIVDGHSPQDYHVVKRNCRDRVFMTDVRMSSGFIRPPTEAQDLKANSQPIAVIFNPPTRQILPYYGAPTADGAAALPTTQIPGFEAVKVFRGLSDDPLLGVVFGTGRLGQQRIMDQVMVVRDSDQSIGRRMFAKILKFCKRFEIKIEYMTESTQKMFLKSLIFLS